MSTHTLVRSLEIPASKKDIFDVVNDFKYFNQYQAWYLGDPQLEYSISDPSSGEGAYYKWKSPLVGSGDMTIEKSCDKHEGLVINLNFLQPRSVNNTVTWTIEELAHKPGFCKVSWSLEYTISPFLFFMKSTMKKMMDMMIGSSYELGLLRLAQIVNKDYSPLKIEVHDFQKMEPMHYIGIRFKRVPTKEIGALCSIAYPQLQQCLASLQIVPKYAFVSYERFKLLAQTVEGEISMAVEQPLDDFKEAIDEFNKSNPLESGSNQSLLSAVSFGTHPAQDIAKITYHDKDYNYLIHAWDVVMMRAYKLQSRAQKNMPHFDIYMTMPQENGELGVTDLCVPIDIQKKQKLLHG